MSDRMVYVVMVEDAEGSYPASIHSVYNNVSAATKMKKALNSNIDDGLVAYIEDCFVEDESVEDADDE